MNQLWRLRSINGIECLSEIETVSGERVCGVWGDTPEQSTHVDKMAIARSIIEAHNLGMTLEAV